MYSLTRCVQPMASNSHIIFVFGQSSSMCLSIFENKTTLIQIHFFLQAGSLVLVRPRIEPATQRRDQHAINWTNPVVKRTSSRGISSFLSHLFGHGRGNFVHSSARCAWKENNNYLTNWLNWWHTFTEYMHLFGYEFRSDLYQNVLCRPEYISSVMLVNSLL